MDLAVIAERFPIGRFPRPRGDGPDLAFAHRSASRVSPPTRGWTLAHASLVGGLGGFPAHAGMDPWRSGVRMVFGGFPRPRGDGPPIQCWVFSVDLGFPAHAGMDPYVEARGFTVGPGFPAHAGMDPSRRQDHGEHRRFPRPRGDGPW